MAEEAYNVALAEKDAGVELSAPVGTLSNEKRNEGNAAFPGHHEGYEWDPIRQGYFPKIDDDYIAYYQASYGYVVEDGVVKAAPTLPAAEPSAATDETTAKATTSERDPVAAAARAASASSAKSDASTPAPAGESAEQSGDGEKGQQQGKKRKAAPEPAWFEIEETKNNNVYVTGLPLDYSEQEFYDLMSKCGIVKDDEETEEPKLKLYRTPDGQLKGDGRCCYLKHESIALAIQILDGSMVGSNTITVQQAKFEMDPTVRPVKKKKKKTKKKTTQEKQLGWGEHKVTGPLRRKSDKIVILRHCFDPKDFDEDACLITEIRDSMKEGCEKCGPVHKVIVYDRHPEGVVSVAFKDFEGAEECLKMMNGRWYAGRQLAVSVHDGVTNYEIEETEGERESRMKKYEEFISKDDEKPSTGGEATSTSLREEVD